MIVKIHKTPDGKKLVAICDSSLLGKKFEEGKLQLDLSSEFYKGEEKGPEEVKKIIKDAYLVNIVGGESIAFFIKLGIIDKGCVMKVADIPHTQAVIC
jgi:hypothetical protein